MKTVPEAGPSLLDALSLLSEVADELVVKSVRDTHYAVHDRVGSLTRSVGGSAPDRLHRGIASAVYGSLSLGLTAASRGLDRVAATGVGPKMEDTPRGRFVSSAVNGLIGDRLLRERPHMAIPLAVRVHGRDVWPDVESLTGAFPDATDTAVVFLHGLCENESYWDFHRERTGTTYAETVRAAGATPVFLRMNSGLPLRENGVALAALLQRVTDAWPVALRRIVLVGHSMGGLVIRAAGAVSADPASPAPVDWTSIVSDVVTLGTPHLGAPIAWGIGHGSRGLGRLPETAAFGRILDQRSRGVHDLVVGLTDDVAPLPVAEYHLVAATLSEKVTHPVGHVVGDLLVRPRSAYGRDRAGRELFPGAEIVHVGKSDHFGLLNHPDVHEKFRTWLG